MKFSNAEKECTILSISLADLATAQTFVVRVASSFPLHSRRSHLLRRSQHLRLGARKRVCGSARAHRNWYVPSVSMRPFSLQLPDRPGATRGFTYPAEAPPPHDPNVTLPLFGLVPARITFGIAPPHSSAFTVYRPSRGADARIISAGMRIHCHCSNWLMDGGQVD
ncbi:hypothetical protein EDB84DRAFT_774199 [Lactarius hengduanensis]|nr:hypothetical protein EDB84DRAFT_774199 [Lactarius hengduanensis]